MKKNGGEILIDHIAYLMTAATIVGTVANSFQKRWCFVIWACTNTFWTVYNVLYHQYAQAILYLFNFVMALVGLYKWGCKAKQKHIHQCSEENHSKMSVNE